MWCMTLSGIDKARYCSFLLSNFKYDVVLLEAQRILSFAAAHAQTPSTRSTDRLVIWIVETEGCEGNQLGLCFDPGACDSGILWFKALVGRECKQVPSSSWRWR